MARATEKAIKRLKSRLPLISTYLRVKGARALIGTGKEEAVSPLLNALRDKNDKVRANAFLALHTLKDAAKNYLCSLWAEGRNKEMEEIILKAGYIASKPPLLTALTAFLNGERPAIPLSQEILDRCLTDSDKRIVTRAIEWIMETKGSEAYTLLWEFVKRHPNSPVIELLNKKGWYPQEPAERALFYFLANDLDAYHNIDFEQSFLRIWYETGSKALKEVIASRIRRNGDTRLLAIFRTERGGKKRVYTYEEIDLQIGLLLESKNYKELFSLLRFTTYAQGRKIITSLKDAGWKHPDPRLRELQERLEKLMQKTGKEEGFPASYAHAIYQDFRPMLLGEEKPPEDERTLLAWTEDKSFRRRSAACVLLAERGSSNLPEVANRASGDPYWQVRMAAAVAELLRPHTLSPTNKALLEEDHVYYVQAILKMPSAPRLIELSPEGIETLKEEGKISDPSHKPEDADNFLSLIRGFLPSAEREYLLLLAEFLETGIMVSEEISYEAGETDVEIEME